MYMYNELIGEKSLVFSPGNTFSKTQDIVCINPNHPYELTAAHIQFEVDNERF